ncbi:glycosyltransferase [Acinetobacter sp. YH12090]|uniref:glycosyltransferase n=1 Tax=Acinetobacter sp. YH12090 TaxID=2601081 RepID=UPI0015D29BC7|nr:glycosyltransferase [Acinetobacter sp. YH12090]
MKILVLAQDYPSVDHPYAMAYVHSRNIEYLKSGHDVKVINFNAKNQYTFEKVDIYPFSYELLNSADVILSHAPNIRNHFKVLKKIKNKKICFFFHGHEVLHKYRDYPPAYPWKKESYAKKLVLHLYDILKIKLVGHYMQKLALKNNVSSIFVSSWMKEQFIKNVKLDPEILGKTAIISNACNSIFFKSQYNFDQKNKLADYITIRPLDDSKYAIDLVLNFAKNNPDKYFHIYGKGNYFNFNEKPKNVEVFKQFIQQKDIPELLNKYKFAIMPTRYDAQGVMVCEMATYGIPLITTDFSVCLEMLSSFSNVYFLKEEEFSTVKSEKIILADKNDLNYKFSPEKLIRDELDFINAI